MIGAVSMRRSNKPSVTAEEAWSSGDVPEPPPPIWQRPSWRTAVLLTATLVATAATGALWWQQRGDEGGVPVQRPEVTYVLHPMSAGESFSMGGMGLTDLEGDVEILEIIPTMSPNLEYLGANTVWPRDFPTSNLGMGPGFPSPDQKRTHPALGVVVPHSEQQFTYPDGSVSRGISVTTGFRVVSGDVGAVNGVTVVYRDGGKVKRHHFRQAAIGCIKPNPCESAEKDPKIDFADEVLYRFGLIPRPSGLDR